MFYVSEIYNHDGVPLKEGTYSDISLAIIRNTQTDYYKEFYNVYDIQSTTTKIAGTGTTYLHAFNKYEVQLMQMLQLIGVDCDYPQSSFQKRPNTLQFDYLANFDTFVLYKDARLINHFSILDLIPTSACCVDTFLNGSANIYIYCCFGNDFVKYYVEDYNSFIVAFTKYNIRRGGSPCGF